MPHCRTCSTSDNVHFCAKVTTKWKPGEMDGKDSCAHCDPDFVQDRIRMPVEQKLWLMADVEPNEYEFRDGTRKMKDWADAEFGDRLARDPDAPTRAQVEDAKTKKRAQAREGRKTPLTQEEIRRLDALYRGAPVIEDYTVSNQADAREGA